MMDKILLLKIKQLIIKAGRIALDIKDKGIEVEWKKDGSPVTNADKDISDLIFNELSRLTTNIPIICEERLCREVEIHNQFWLVDPIDGTKSFISKENSFTVNIAFIDNKSAVYGFIYQPATDILYFTDENKNFCIEYGGNIVDRKPHNIDGFVAVVSSNNFNKTTKKFVEENNFLKIIPMPSSIKLCMVAEGVADIYPKFGTTMEWDIAAGHALIKATGGDIYTLDGNVMSYAKDNFQNSHFIAANQKWCLKDNKTI